MDTIKINAGNRRYISEIEQFSNGLPLGVLNKGRCDVGGTYHCMNCESNYITVAPFISLIDSIMADPNNKFNILPVYGGISKKEVSKYIGSNEIKKIAVTYDSFPKLLDILEELGEDLNNYSVLVDEYHLLIQQFGFRQKAISGLINNVKRVPVYTFLTATPVNFEFEVQELKELPHYEILWEGETRLKPELICAKSVVKTLTNFVYKFNQNGTKTFDIEGNLDDVKELFIFVNSVETIAEVCEKAGLRNKDIKICCSDTKDNRSTLGVYKISKVTDPNKKINFFTSKCFEGCNLFSESGLIIVASDSNKNNTLLDIDTSLIQIAGRLRETDTVQNKFKGTIIHIYNSTNSNTMSDEDFSAYMNEKNEDAGYLISGSEKLSSKEKQVYIPRLDIESDVVIVEGESVKYSEMKEKYFRYKQELKKDYVNKGVKIREKYINNKKFNTEANINYTPLQVQLLESSTDSFQRLSNLYYNCSEDVREYFEDKELKNILKNFTQSQVSTLRYNKESLLKELNKDNNTDKLEEVFQSIYNKIGGNGFISLKELKSMISEEFKNKGITDIKPKANLIESSKTIKAIKSKIRIDGVQINGYELSKEKWLKKTSNSYI